MASVDHLYSASLAQLAAESYLTRVDLTNRAAIDERLLNGNNHFIESQRPSIRAPNLGLGSTRLTRDQRDEFFNTYDIIDHLPNQSSGFSATLLKNKSTGEYTLAFRSTEYRDIRNGGDAERDSIRGAAGDIAFNGMAFAQVSSMEKYWASLLDGTRALGATPDNPAASDTAFLRAAELEAFRASLDAGTRINVSGYSLGGHLATVFSTFHGEQVSSLYLFNSSGVGRIRDGFPATAYRDALATYETFMRPENFDAAILRAIDWASRVDGLGELGLGAKLRMFFGETGLLGLFSGRAFLPKEFASYVNDPTVSMTFAIGGLITLARDQFRNGIPRGADNAPVLASSALHFLVSLFASEALEGTYAQTVHRGLGGSLPSLQESGFIPPDVAIYQISGRAASGAPSVATFEDMAQASDWNIVADSGIRAAPDSGLLSVYIEDQPVAAGVPFSDRGWGDFGNTHSITLIVDSLAVIRLLQNAHPTLSQEAAEELLRAASNLRKETYNLLPFAALAEHDTLERVVDAFGRVLFGRRTVGEIDWAKDLASADGVASFGLLEYREPFYARIRAIENELAVRALAGNVTVVSLAGWTADSLVAAAGEATEQGMAVRYALKELNPFYVLGAGLYDTLGRDQTLALYDPATGTGSITAEWLADRAEFLALKLRLGGADHAYELGAESVLYSTASGESALSIATADAAGLLAPDAPMSTKTRAALTRLMGNRAASGRARMVLFGADGDPAANPATVEGGADTLQGRAGSDRLYGEGGNDKLFGGAGADYLSGGPGDDDLTGGTGNDVLAGGPGYDSYFWQLGDGSDVIVEVREESSGQMRGRIVLRLDTTVLVPRLFKRDGETPGEVWRSPDRNLVLTHGASWILSFVDGEIDLGPDLRDGDLGLRLEGVPTPPSPTVLDGDLFDRVSIGAGPGGDPIIAGEYGHDQLYSEAVIEVDAALLAANVPALEGWGFWLSGGPGDDVAIGTAAADIVFGGGGADTLVGGAGNDFLDGDMDLRPLPNGHQREWDFAPAPEDSFLTDFISADLELAGTSIFTELFRDQIEEADDILHGGGGDDRMYGRGGDDVLYGDSGDDVLAGGAGDDVLIGGDGADRITGEMHGYAPVPFEIIGNTLRTYLNYVASYGDDIIDGGAGDDELIGEGGSDILSGGDGADTIYGDIEQLPGALHGNDILDGGDGDDVIHGQGGHDHLYGGNGDDVLIGDSGVEAQFHGADTLKGDAGDDLLIGAGGADDLQGGSGDDTLFGDAADVPDAFQGNDVLDGGAGNDTLYGQGGSDELFGSDGNDRLYGDDPESPFTGAADYLDGGSGDDVLHGQAGNDRLLGGEGNDVLFGEAGDDTLVGGPGADVLDGGPGDNVYEFALGDGADRVIAGTGTITIAFTEGFDAAALRASRDLASGAGIAPLQLQYSATDSITVEGLTDTSKLRIRIGDADVMNAAELVQITQSVATVATGSAAGELLFASTEAPHLFGLEGDDVLVGSVAGNRLHGGSGDDELYGLEGDDELLGGDGADWLLAGLGNDRLEGGGGDDRYELAPDAGIDSVVELPGEGFDFIALAEGLSLASVRLRKADNDLVLAERGGSSRLFVRDWYAPGREGDRGIDAILAEGTLLDADGILARELTDRTLAGTAAADSLTGDEFSDVLIGGLGDDILAGLAGDDRYVYLPGDGADRIVDSGGFDIVEFGAGIEAGAIEFIGRPDGAGSLEIELRIAGFPGGSLIFGGASSQRIDAFHFASGEVYDYGVLLQRAGGLRVEGGGSDDLVRGSFFRDALYGFAGNDTLRAEAGADLLVGAEGNDFLAGGANDDVYVFERGDGRDSILEYRGTDEYLLFRGYFTPSGHRAFDLDGVSFVTHEPLPGAFGETFNITLGSVAGGVDTIQFGADIAPEDIRFGLDLGKSALPYVWLVPDASGGFSPATTWAEQVAYVLEIGDNGDAIEILWPNVELSDHRTSSVLDDIPVERLIFGGAAPITVAELFALAGGLTYVIGTAHDDVLTYERVLAGGWLAGGAGDDRYLYPEQGALGVLELVAGGSDTIVFGDAVAADAVRLRLDQGQFIVDAGGARVELLGFDRAKAEQALVERFEFADGSALEYADLLGRGIQIAGTDFNDVLTGTSAYDFVLAGAGRDVIDTGAGNDIVAAGAGDDLVELGAGDDWIAAGPGTDTVRGGAGSDVYVFGRGDGDDVIEERGIAGQEDTLHFAGDIAPQELAVHRAGDDMVVQLTTSGERITLRDWFAADAMRVERVVFNDGTVWDAAGFAAGAGEVLPPPTDPAPSEPPADPPVVEEPGAAASGPPQAEEAVDTPASPAPSAASPATPVPQPPSGTSPSPAPAPSIVADLDFSGMATGSTRRAGSSAEAATGTATIAETSAAASEASAPATPASGAATFEALAAAGFVSPGRPPSRVAESESESETVEVEATPADEAPADTPAEATPSPAIAAYWRWMHARLEEHLERSEPEDLGAPAMHAYGPVGFDWSGGPDALAPARTLGIRDRLAFEARAFEGLRDGFARLG